MDGKDGTINPNANALKTYINYLNCKKMAAVVSLSPSGKVLYIFPSCNTVELFIQNCVAKNPSIEVETTCPAYGLVDDPFLWIPIS